MLSTVKLSETDRCEEGAADRVNLTLALRTLRLSKSNLYVPNTNDVQENKRRRIISLAEVADHDTIDDCWIVLYDRIYEVTAFLHSHPGGMDVILDYAGRDASLAFRGHPKIALLSLKQFEIGELPEKERIYRREGLLRDDIPD